MTHSLALTLHQEADVSVGHTGSRHVHNATVWLAPQCILGLCGELFLFLLLLLLLQVVLDVWSSSRSIKMVKLKGF